MSDSLRKPCRKKRHSLDNVSCSRNLVAYCCIHDVSQRGYIATATTSISLFCPRTNNWLLSPHLRKSIVWIIVVVFIHLHSYSFRGRETDSYGFCSQCDYRRIGSIAVVHLVHKTSTAHHPYDEEWQQIFCRRLRCYTSWEARIPSWRAYTCIKGHSQYLLLHCLN